MRDHAGGEAGMIVAALKKLGWWALCALIIASGIGLFMQIGIPIAIILAAWFIFDKAVRWYVRNEKAPE
ncbi:hypothetical protein GJ654_10245 [Rhodoblastus acidophilus]|uniref:Uncharacterized protein n=1 Tax=Rhodoblastus acidophilus TaxID=1074 RepID=A0A6N8DQ98_RHOAC|nr:hypothetical protein [Rhodoblastus acidophilus]MCW2275103.1 hypothetical protein [Rhodoblastus acidophilus]MTV31373.1 hypothetical protein [Rhodoblastus acidophilus]